MTAIILPSNKSTTNEEEDIVDYSHKEKTFAETEFYNKISYDFAFDIDIDKE
ncbi:MAG: hypothetical protein IKI04_02960 [Bacilli bacterium]|nr:hypothetical protein [Bacilli bacterium]